MNTHRGFTLIEMVVVLFIIGIVMAMAFSLTRAVTDSQRRALSTKALSSADLGLTNFVMMTKRLPCPADGALASTAAGAGVEMRNPGTGQCTTQARGVLPWVTLGMQEQDVTDGYGNRLTYRVGTDLVADNALALTACDSAGAAGAVLGNPGNCAACVDGAANVPDICTGPKAAIAGRGLVVKDGTAPAANVLADPGSVVPSGAAYVVISHGPNQSHAYNAQGGLVNGIGTVGAGEDQNNASLGLQPYYVDGTAAADFDDIMARSTVMSLVMRAGLGPRNHRPS